MPDLDPEVLASVAESFGTPVYVYDAVAIRRTVARLLASLETLPSRALYSAKANPAVGIAALMRGLGLGFDACSPGDLVLAQLAGFPMDEISYTSFGATDAELVSAASVVADIVLDTPDELIRLGELGVSRPIGVRVNPGIKAGFHPHVGAGAPAAKFGIRLEELAAFARQAADADLPLVGLHAHLGSDIMTPAAHLELLDLLLGVADQLPELGWLNVGGGFGTPRRPEQAHYPWTEFARAAGDRLASAGNKHLELRVEPGGHLLMDAGFLLGAVIGVRSADAHRPVTVVTDVNTNHLPSVLLYDAHHRVTVVGAERRRPLRRYRVAGNLMQAGDVLASEVELPEVRRGDLLLMGQAGAYAASRATSFNERPRAAEVLLDGSKVTLLRRAETLEELFGRDSHAHHERPDGD